MKVLKILAGIISSVLLHAQEYPDYRVLVPENVVLNHSCMVGRVRQTLQNVNGYADPASAAFMHVASDMSGNLYFTGFADFSITPNTPDSQYPTAVPEITMGSNTAQPQKYNRSDGYKFFLTKYGTDGTVKWMNFFNEPPLKLYVDDAAGKVYVLFRSNQTGMGLNGTTLPADSAGTDKVIFTFDLGSGAFQNYYSIKFIADLLMAGNKKIVIYSKQLTSISYEIRYGFWENNQVTKWQTELAGTNDMPAELYYNPYQNSLWYTLNKLTYKRLFFHPTTDSLIAENISRPLHYSYSQPYSLLNTIRKFYFLPDGNYLGEYLGNFGGQYRPQLMKCDTAGNVIWKITFPDQQVNAELYSCQIDAAGDVWLDLPTGMYFEKINVEPSSKTYFMNVYGNTGILTNNLWKMDGSTGELKNAYYNGYGNINYSVESTPHTKKQLLHITAANQLISAPQIGAIAYYPDAVGNFKPYYTECANQILPSQFMWARFNLNNLQSYKREETFENEWIAHSNPQPEVFSVYPNPSTGSIFINTTTPGDYCLYDALGRKADCFQLQHQQNQLDVSYLPKGVYVMKKNDAHLSKKIIIQ